MYPNKVKTILFAISAGLASAQFTTLANAVEVLHADNVSITRGDTPRLRLVQDASSGFTTQTWDLAGNEANFFIRDVTNGNTLPLKIRPGAPSNALYIADTGYVGIGDTSPDSKLTLSSSSGTETDTQVLVENTNGTATARKLFVIKNNGPAKFSMFSSGANEWAFNGRDNEFRISKQGTGDVEMELSDTGNLTITGAYASGSSRSIKHDIVPVDTSTILEKVIATPISTWSYNRDAEGVRHLGPMAEDFFESFGLGHSNKTITSIDTGGVALAAIKGLHAQVVKRDTEIEALKAQLGEQEGRMLQLEMALTELLQSNSSEVQVTARN